MPNAIADTTAAIDIAPGSADLYERRARIRMEQGEHERAVDDLTAALRIDPKNKARLLLRGMEWGNIGELEKALNDCRAALAIDPKELMAYYYMALAHSLAGQKKEAIRDFDAALQIDPDDTHIRFLREYELFNQGRFDQALADLEELIKKGKHVADAYAWRAYFRLVRQEWDKAVADYTEAIRLKADENGLLSRRAMCWLQLKEFDKALRDADEALRLDPASEEAAGVRRQALARKVDPLASPVTEAVVEFAKTIEHKVSAVPLGQTYHIELRAPAGVRFAYEGAVPDEVGGAMLSLPARLPMLSDAVSSFRLTGIPGGAMKTLYARLKSKRLSADEIEILRAATPMITLTKADLDAASSGEDVTKTLVLRSHEGDQARQPEFEVVNRTDLGELADPLTVASLGGTPVATLTISTRLPPLFPSLTDQGLVALCLQGPMGLQLAHELLGPGRFEDPPLSFPAHFGLLPGIQIRFKFSGPAVSSGEPLYALLTVPRERPANADWPASTELPITISQADLEAAAAGKMVTCVFYLAGQRAPKEAPSLQSLSSAQAQSDEDPVAQASQLGTIVAVLKFSTRLTDLPSSPVLVDSADTAAGTDGKPRAPDR